MRREEYDAKLVSANGLTDLALFKISSRGSLPTIPLVVSARLQIGEWVIAIGPGGAAAAADIRVGDVIEQIARRLIRSLDDFARAMAAAKDNDTLLVLIRRGGSSSLQVLRRQD